MQTEPTARARIWRAAPFAALLVGAAGAAWLLGDLLSFETLAQRRDVLRAWTEAHGALAAAAFVAAYAVAVALSAPGAVWFTIAGGFLFGAVPGAALSVTGATIGAVGVFLAVRAGLAGWATARVGGWMEGFAERFRQDAASFLLALRLAPVAPFFVVNLAAALLGAPLRTFVWTTFLGIIPGGFVFASVGAGLDSVIARGEAPDLGVVFDWPVLGPLLGLAALSLAPAVWRSLRRG